jgi:two-component system, NtrC family, sensor kinase
MTWVNEQEKIQALEKENRILRKKLERIEIEQTQLEETNLKKELLLKKVIQELQVYQKQLEEKSTELEVALQVRKQQAQDLEITLKELQHTQAKLVQTEKMSSLGQLVAGIAHEINNPVGFIHSNILPARDYIQDLLNLIKLYQEHYPQPTGEISQHIEEIELDFIIKDLPSLISSMQVGTERIRQIVLSLRNFSRLDEAEIKYVDIHEGLDSTLMILEHRFKGELHYLPIKVVKKYTNLPFVECCSGQLNQVFMNILINAIDALKEKNSNQPSIIIKTEVINNQYISISIADNGIGISDEIKKKLFDPFFTTKPVGKGTGMGLSISYQIITVNHRGKLFCYSSPGKGAEFIIQIPINMKYDIF